MRIRVIVDLDSVTANLCKKWFDEYNSDYYDTLTIDDILTWDTHLYVKSECRLNIYSYLDKPGFFRDLEPIDGAVEALTWVHANFELIIATSRPAQAHEDTVAWVSEHLPFLDSDNLVFAGRKDLLDGDILIDDCPKHLNAFRGVSMVFGNYPYNSHLRQFTQAKDWITVCGYLLQLLGT